MSDNTHDLKLWRWQRRSALLLLPLVAFHLYIQYFVVGIDKINFETTAARLSGGLLLVIDGLLLAMALSHGLLGLRTFVIDYARSPSFARRTTIGVLIVLIAALAYGVAALFALR